MFSSGLRRSNHRLHSAAAVAGALAGLQFLASIRDERKSVHLTANEASATPQACGQDASEKDDMFENQCLKRQMRVPKIPYPAWDYNWDGKETHETSLEGHRRGLHKTMAAGKKTRHIILVRHGQYDETFKEDELRKLTPLGRLQAIRTGKRLKEMMEGAQHFDKEEFRGPCHIKAIHVSNMTRAKETAQLIAAELNMSVNTPDPDLNEGLPAPMIPIRPDIKESTETIDKDQDRIERAFQRYFYRDTGENEAGNESIESIDSSGDEENADELEELDEFEIIVCHGKFCAKLSFPRFLAVF